MTKYNEAKLIQFKADTKALGKEIRKIHEQYATYQMQPDEAFEAMDFFVANYLDELWAKGKIRAKAKKAIGRTATKFLENYIKQKMKGGEGCAIQLL